MINKSKSYLIVAKLYMICFFALPYGNAQNFNHLNINASGVLNNVAINKIAALKNSPASNLSSDTLWIGLVLYDTLKITGNYTHTGPIVVVGNGVLQIKKANFINDGDLFVLTYGKVLIDSSALSFPQTYFYQRNMIGIENAYIEINNSSLDYSGLSHNMVLANNAIFNFKNVTQNSFTTTGMNHNAKFFINGTNKAGEFVTRDSTTVYLKNATTALLWHQFPDTADINWSFGRKDTAYGYVFNKNQVGVKGIRYTIYADSVYDVMWAMMPGSGSKVNITDSKIRACGFWFDRTNDSTHVSGFFDSTNYVSFNAPLTDRTFNLTNTYVQTWSLYVFKQSKISVTNCKVGEIGAQQKSKVYGWLYTVDGTGGYHWTTDSTTTIATGLIASTYVRSEKTGIFIVANSSVLFPEALDKSILIVVQSNVYADPLPRDGAVAWYANVIANASVPVNSNVNLFGSAWIDRGPTSTLMDFQSWELFYQKQGDANWTSITGLQTTEIRTAILSNWNTNGLTTGNYTLKLTLTCNTGFAVDATKDVVLTSGVGINENDLNIDYTLFPNPVQQKLYLFANQYLNDVTLRIFNVNGQLVHQQQNNAFTTTVELDLSQLSNGLYSLQLLNKTGTLLRKKQFVITH